MYWNHIIILSFVLFASFLNAKNNLSFNEDKLIITGIFYEENKDYENSYLTYKKLFKEEHLKIYLMEDIYYALHSNTHLNETIKMIKGYIHTHKDNEVNKDLYNVLIKFYKKTQDKEGVLDAYKSIYKISKREIDTYTIIYLYRQNNDMDGAIDFLEKNNFKGPGLYGLYMIKHSYNKAMAFTDKIYKIDKDPIWLARKAMLILKTAKSTDDKNMILKKALFLFSKAIKYGYHYSRYLNYYGYLLIDNNIDINKGIKLIKKALKIKPNNGYYIDSLAWGYYKIKECKKAYTLMKKIVDKDVLKDTVITKHWNAIQKCK